jgi:phospholipid/cholesterol/gamma-HCH transport system substrate-binding protein
MARKRFSNFLLGLFVTGGFLLLAFILVWVGAGKLFGKGKKYVSYFSESVQGLDKDSEVKFRGVKVGRVDNIFIAPDNRHVGVVMSINLKFNPSKDSVAQLRMTGITGILYVNLSPREAVKNFVPEKLTFVPEYPVIPSEPSEIKTILAGVKEVIADLKQINAQGISEDIQGTLKEAKGALKDVQTFFGGPKTKRLISQLEGTSGNLQKLSGRINQDVSKGELGKIMAEARGTLEGAHALVDKAKKDLNYMGLPETFGKGRVTLTQINALIDKLNDTTETLNRLIERIYERPSDILFGKSPPKRFNE